MQDGGENEKENAKDQNRGKETKKKRASSE